MLKQYQVDRHKLISTFGKSVLQVSVVTLCRCSEFYVKNFMRKVVELVLRNVKLFGLSLCDRWLSKYDFFLICEC